MDSYQSEPGGHGSLADFLSRTRDSAKLDVSVGVLHSQLLTLRNVSLHKSGDLLVGQAQLSQQALSAALPTFLDLSDNCGTGSWQIPARARLARTPPSTRRALDAVVRLA
jgi:hypothetical protein